MEKHNPSRAKESNRLEESMGASETFFGLPILVAVELASGFIFSEAVCENRTYETWWEQVSGWFNREQWDCRGLVSDEAKALVKLALSGLGCLSIPDLFHLLNALSKSIGAALARQRAQLQKQQQALQTKLKATTSPALITQVETKITALQAQQHSVETDHDDYQQTLHTLTLRHSPLSPHHR